MDHSIFFSLELNQEICNQTMICTITTYLSYIFITCNLIIIVRVLQALYTRVNINFSVELGTACSSLFPAVVFS